MPRIVRFRDLEPSWTTKQAKEPGFMRWLVTWVGGPAGHINTNPGIAIESTQCAIGMMYLPRGQRQAGRHTHGVTEIYVVLQGELEGFDASGHPHRAGPMDCTYIPAGCPHGVRNCGLQDVILIWVHDGIERDGIAIYYADDHEFTNAPPIQLVRFGDLEPDWSDPGARTPGTMRWSVNWVGDREDSRNHNSKNRRTQCQDRRWHDRSGTRAQQPRFSAAAVSSLSRRGRRGDHRYWRRDHDAWPPRRTVPAAGRNGKAS
jgi:mannose-6-phosphate isomerase-like protein (cupin superfamily)